MTTSTLPTSAIPSETSARDELPHLSGHLPALDGLRGIAIVLVMLCHFIPHSDHPSSLAGKLFFFVSQAGWCGVDLFFVLSGFLITGILLDAKADATPHYFRNFYARRTLRIFPLYYGALIAVFLIIPLIWRNAFATPELAEVRRQQGWLWFYGTNIKMMLVNDNGIFYAGWLDLNPFWSLAVEEHFYLLWPAVVWFASRRGLIGVCVGVILGSLALRGIMLHRGDNEWGIYVFTPCRADALALGGLLAAVLREGGGVARSLVKHARVGSFALGLAWIASLAINPARDRWWSMTFGYTLAAAFFGVLLVMSISIPAKTALAGPFNARFMRLLGKYSYGLYVYHVLLHGAFERFLDQRKLADVLRSHAHLGGAAYGISVVLYIVLAGAASLAVAFTSWHLFEKQFIKLKRFFEYHRAKPATP